QEVTAYALLPAGPPPLKGALLAVAINDGGVISVALYDVTTGRQVRQCTGPTTFVRSLAFSADGRLLAAAADDQTVSVWTLTNLAEIVGQHGLIRGLFVKDDARGRPVVDGVKGLDDKTIRPGDVVEGLVVDGKLTKPTDSAQQFYRAVWEIAPARQKTVTVRVGGRDVTLGVGQGVDERKPLLSLFVTAADKAGRREWVGWSPVGPYDAGSRETERLVGWHVNTGATDRPPARLALAEQYKDNYKPGILQKLAEYANVGRAIEAWRPPQEGPPPDPNMKPGLEEDGRALTPEGGNHFRVGRRRVAMTLTLDGFPADKIGSLDWEAFGKRESLTDHGNHKWTANLSELPWQRGEHTINVRLRTKGANPREYTAALVVRYQPTAPRLAEARTHPVATDKDPYPVKLHVIPTADGEPVHVTLFRKGDDKPLLDLQGISKPQDVGKDVPLAGEENLIQAVAENEGAPAGAAGEAERARWDVRVTYNVPRPQIALKQIVLPDGSALRIDPDHPEKVLPVDVPTFNVKGEVAALADLVGAEWVQDKGEAKALAGFDPASPKKKLPIDQPVTLSAPGVPVVLTFRARSAKAEKWEERRFTVEYRPRLPVATMAGPANGEIFYEGEEPDPRRVPVVVTLQWPPTDAHPCQARLVVNGKAQGEPQTLKKDATRYQGQALLEPGPNTVEVRLSNDWRKEQKDQAVVGPVTVYYRRPPVVSMKPGMTANKPPRVRVDAEVVSPAGPPLRAEFRVTPLRKDGLRPTGDTEKTVVVRAADMKKGDKGTVWTFGADLPLDAGDNEISLVAFNKDGVSRKPAVAKVTYTSPPPPRPTARFTDPADNANTVSANYKVRFIVTSDSPLTKVQLRRDRDEVLFEATAAALRAAPRDGPGFRYEAEAPVKLDRGPNKLCAVTANADGGEDVTPYVIINYHYRPAVRVTIEALEVGGERLPPEGEPREGILSFPPAAAGRVAVRGRVSCDKDHAEALAKLTRLDVTVNGYHQLPARLDDAPPGALSRAFRLPDILLDREKGNDIDVLPPVADPPFVVTADSRARCTVDCKDRVKSLRRRLHLLAIDLDGTRDQAIKGALAAVVGSDLKGDQFKVPYCDVGGRLYGPLTGADVTPSTVTAQLAAIKDRLRENAEGGAVHDVVMVYYRGDVVRIGGVQYFQTSMSRPLPKPRPPTMVCCDELERFFGETQGAHLVFLDVTEAPVAAAAQPGGGTDLVSARREPHVAILRYTWSGGAGPQPPTAPHVLTDLGTAMAKSGRLEDVQDKVAAGFAKAGLDKQPLPSRLFPENSWLSYWLPAEMRALPFGATARAP
ncbi:MAG TPA: WD40 repeat domain-containing protein, partial [Gemmataceae bacterium]|nr:WD40 repeat domain-containing protein [Gemmataceae bacterium]